MTSDKNFSHKTRAGILYFSGAGNTECIATFIRDALTRRENCELVFFERIRRALNIRALPEFDLLGIGYPIYFRRTPAIVFDTIGQLRGRGQKVFTFCTKGMYSGNVAREVLSRCVASGLVPAGHFEAFMPGSDALLLFARKGSWTEKLIKKMHSRHLDRKIDRFIQGVFKTGKIPIPRTKWYTPLENRIVKPLEHLITRDYQVFKQGYHVLTDRCTRCLLCVRSCPEENIRLEDGKILFGNRCDLCLRCIHHCPPEAIQLGAKTLKTVRYRPATPDFLDNPARDQNACEGKGSPG